MKSKKQMKYKYKYFNIPYKNYKKQNTKSPNKTHKKMIKFHYFLIKSPIFNHSFKNWNSNYAKNKHI